MIRHGFRPFFFLTACLILGCGRQEKIETNLVDSGVNARGIHCNPWGLPCNPLLQNAHCRQSCSDSYWNCLRSCIHCYGLSCNIFGCRTGCSTNAHRCYERCNPPPPEPEPPAIPQSLTVSGRVVTKTPPRTAIVGARIEFTFVESSSKGTVLTDSRGKYRKVLNPAFSSTADQLTVCASATGYSTKCKTFSFSTSEEISTNFRLSP